MQEKKILFVPFALLAFLILLPVVMAGEDVLFIDVAHLAPDQDAAVSKVKLIEINWDALDEGKNKELSLNLFDGLKIRAIRERLDKQYAGNYVWVGHAPDLANSAVTISVVDSTVVGSVALDGYEKYIIRQGSQGQILQQIDHRRQIEIEMDDEILVHAQPNYDDEKISYCEDGSQIDLLVAYTEATRVKFGSTAATRAFINQRVSEMNSANINSGLNFKYRLVQAIETIYQESGDVSVDLTRLKWTGDGRLDDVTAARDRYKADLTSLIVSEAEAGSACGIAYVMNEMSTHFASYAYNVVALDYAGNNLTCNSLTMAHEFGHNMGNQHDRANSSSPPILPFAYGYQSPRQRFRTIMAYDCPGGCPRINYWSNPDSSFLGEAMGIGHDSNSILSADNVRAMEEAARHVANFRQNCPVADTPTATATAPPGALPTATPLSSSFPNGHRSFAPVIVSN